MKNVDWKPFIDSALYGLNQFVYNNSGRSAHDITSSLTHINDYVECSNNRKYDLEIIHILRKCEFQKDENIKLKNKILQDFSNTRRDKK